MSTQAQGYASGAAQAVGANLAIAALSTPPGQAAIAGTVALGVAAAPVVVVVAATAGIVYATAKLAEWLDF